MNQHAVANRIRWSRRGRNSLFIGVLLLITMLGMTTLAPDAYSASAEAPLIHLPFGPGKAWVISQGYNTSPSEDGSHWNCDVTSLRDHQTQSSPCRIGWQYKYSLDFQLENGETIGETVLSPVSGTVGWVDQSAGVVSISFSGNYAVAVSHVSLESGIEPGQPLIAGQPLGTVASDQATSDHDSAHVQLTVWETNDSGNWDRKAVPFSGSLAIDGYDLPDLGQNQTNQYASTLVYSSNVEIARGETGIPPIPNLFAPVPEEVVASPTTFRWKPAIGADEYQVVVDGNIFSEWSEEPQTTMSLVAGDHTWRLRSRNSVGTSLLSSPHAFTVSDNAGSERPAVSVSQTRAEVGDVITLGGTGFEPGESVTIAGPHVQFLTIAATKAGSFSTLITLPALQRGDTRIEATGSHGSAASTTIEITPSLELEPIRAAPGTNVEITATGFDANEDVELRWRSEDGVALGVITTDQYGTGAITIELPDATIGWNDYTGFGTTSQVRVWGAIEVLPAVVLSDSEADPGDRVTVTGRGFPADTAVSVRFDATSASTGSEICDTETDDIGRASCEFTVPDRDAGGYRISMVIDDALNSSATLVIGGPPAVTTTPDKAAAGTEIEVRVGGFDPGDQVTISFGQDAEWRTIETDDFGVATIKGTVPNLKAGETSVSASVENGETEASSSFTVSSIPEFGETSMTGSGKYKVVATREGLVGGTTSNGHVIVENDHFVSLPACTASSCPWYEPGRVDERWGLRTECGDKCYVKVINEETGSCEVAPIWDTGPWFTVDDWWRTGPDRYLNKLRSNPNYLAQGVTGASAARDGLDVGYGIGPDGIGSSNKYTSTGNASAIDLGDGTWTGLGLDFNKGIDVIDVELLWQTGADPSAQATRCGHSLDQPGDSSELTLTPSTGKFAEITRVDGDGFAAGETVTIHMDSPSGTRIGTTRASSSGTISKSVRIPDASYGSHIVVAVGKTSGARKNGTLRIIPSIGRNPTSGSPGTPVSLSIHGYGPNEFVRVSWDNASGSFIANIRTNELGTGSATFTVPNRPTGWNTYYARGGASNAGAYGAFQITPDTSVTYPPGDSATSFSGSRLKPKSSFGSTNGSGSSRVWDRNFGSSWYTTTSNPGSGGFTLDLGKVYQLSGVRWQLRLPGEADSFVVETSIDGRSWKYIGTYGNAPLSTWYGEDLNRQGRYLRVTFGNPNRDARIGGMSEIELWGKAASTSSSSPAPSGSNPSFAGSKLRVASSTSSWGTSTSTRAHDGSLASSWYTTTDNPSQAYLTLDLGSVRTVSGVRWTFRLEGGADSLKLLTSKDGVTWTSAGASSNRKALTWEGLPVKRDARYVRLVFGNPYDADTLGYVAEVEVFGTALTYPGDTYPQGDTNTAFSGSHLTVQSSYSSSNGSGSARVWDRNEATSWYTVTSNPTSGFFQVDLGKVHDLTGVRWKFRLSGEADSMLVQTSSDGSSWNAVGRYGNAPANSWRGEDLRRQGRYVRFIFANPNNDARLGVVSEIEVWGDAGNSSPPDSTALPGSNLSFSGDVLPIVGASDLASPAGIQTSGAGRAIDGYQSTSWYTSGGTPSQAILQLDLGKSRSVSGVKWMYRLSDGVDRQALQVSQDGSSWTQLVVTSARQPDQWEGFAVDRSVRYVRFVLTNNADLPVLGYISEIQVWGQDVEITNPSGNANPTFSGSRLSPSSSYGSNNGSGSARVWDNNLGSSWYTVNANPTGGYFLLKYPTVSRLTGVKWNFRLAGGADAMRIETSVDGSTWRLVGVYGNGGTTSWYGQGLNRDGRYVRFSFTNPNGDAVVGYVAEVELWGTSTTSSAFESQSMESPEEDACIADSGATPIPSDSPPSAEATPATETLPIGQCPSESPGDAPDPAATPVTDATPHVLATPVVADESVTPADGTPVALATPAGEAAEDGNDPGTNLAFGTPEPAADGASGMPEPTSIYTPADEAGASTPQPVSSGRGDGTGGSPPTASVPTPVSTPTAASPAETPSSDQATPPTISTSTATAEIEPAPQPNEAETGGEALATPTIGATPTIFAEPVPTAVAEPTRTVEPTVVATSPVPFESWVGYVVGTDGDPLNCRDQPTPDGLVLGQLEPGQAVEVTGEPVDGWLPVICNTAEAWVSSVFISTIPPASESEPLATQIPKFTTEDTSTDDPETEPEVQATEAPAPTPVVPTAEPIPTPTPEPEPVLVVREVIVPVSSDTSVSGVEGGIEEPVGDTILAMGGPNQYVTAMTFDIGGIGEGTITNATLVVTGAGEASGSPGEVGIISDYRIDPWSVTATELEQIRAAPAARLDWISPGAQSEIDLTGWIPAAGVVTMVIDGNIDQATMILSQESGSPPLLILTIEEWVIPET